MKLVTFQTAGDPRLGCLVDDHIVDLNLAYEGALSAKKHPKARALAGVMVPPDMMDFLLSEDLALSAASDALDWATGQGTGADIRGLPVMLAAGNVRLLAPVPNPPKLICVAQNYNDALAAAGKPPTEDPKIFSKFANAVCGWDDDVVRPAMTEKLGYEAELAFVVGRHCKHVEPEDAYDAIVGYMTFNDITASDLTKKDGQNTRGKGFDTFAVMGPCLVTRDEIPDPHDLKVRLSVDGRTLQDSTTGEMCHRIPPVMSFCSKIFSLVPGDVVATGSPWGLARDHDPQAWLVDGQVMETEIEALGLCRNRIVDEAV